MFYSGSALNCVITINGIHQASATFELLSRHELREPKQALQQLRGEEGKVKESRQNRNVAAAVVSTRPRSLPAKPDDCLCFNGFRALPMTRNEY